MLQVHIAINTLPTLCSLSVVCFTSHIIQFWSSNIRRYTVHVVILGVFILRQMDTVGSVQVSSWERLNANKILCIYMLCALARCMTWNEAILMLQNSAAA